MDGLPLREGNGKMQETVAAHAELGLEREYVAGLYRRLDELRAEKQEQLDRVRRSRRSRVHAEHLGARRVRDDV